MRRIVEISDLPELNSGFQRDYIDEFLMNASRNIDYYIDGDKVLNAYYGHVSNYPKGFMVLIETDKKIGEDGYDWESWDEYMIKSEFIIKENKENLEVRDRLEVGI